MSVGSRHMVAQLTNLGHVKRIVFVLSCFVLTCAWADWGPEVILWRYTPEGGVGQAGAVTDMKVDSENRLHIAYTAVIHRASEHPAMQRRALYYASFDDSGNVVVPVTILTDSMFREFQYPRLALFEPDSIWVMAPSVNDSDDANFRYVTLDWAGNILRPIQVFPDCSAGIIGTGTWVLDVAQDRTVAMVKPDIPPSDTLFVTVQQPDGSRIIDCEPVWIQHPCDQPYGFVDFTDSLQFIWRQFPTWDGWQAIFAKRVGIRNSIPPGSLSDHVELSPATPGHLRVGTALQSYHDTTLILREYAGDLDFGSYIRLLDRETYDEEAMLRTGRYQALPANVGIVGDSVFTLLVRPVGWYGTAIRGYRISDLQQVFESDSIYEGEHTLFTSALAVSPGGSHHIMYEIVSTDQPNPSRLVYRYWREGYVSSVPSRSGEPLSDITVYPNPTNGEVTIQLGSHPVRSVTVYDILGRRVYDQSVDHVSATPSVLHLSVDNLSSGTYFIKFELSYASLTHKLIIVK